MLLCDEWCCLGMVGFVDILICEVLLICDDILVVYVYIIVYLCSVVFDWLFLKVLGV